MAAADISISTARSTAVSNVERYLYLGYLPALQQASTRWLTHEAGGEPILQAKDEAGWIRAGVKAWNETLDAELAAAPAGVTHVVPLSGGLDSRAILAGLLERLPGSQIMTVTYGIPGSWDYELGQRVAKAAGVRHEALDLVDEPWDLNGLVATAACLDNPANVFEAYVRRKMSAYFGPGCLFWSGFLAGSLAGVHLPAVPSAGKEQAVRRFLHDNRTPHYAGEALHEAMVQTLLSEVPWEENLGQIRLSLDQQLDFGIRHRFFIRTVVIVPGYAFKTPFLNSTWLRYILNAPYAWMLHEGLYKKVLSACYPELYRLPVRNNAGLPLSYSHSLFLAAKALARITPYLAPKDSYRSHPRTNYINFTESLRRPGRFHALAEACLSDLNRRNIVEGAQIERWWQEHQQRRSDHTALLLNLCSLEILLKAGAFRS